MGVFRRILREVGLFCVSYCTFLGAEAIDFESSLYLCGEVASKETMGNDKLTTGNNKSKNRMNTEQEEKKAQRAEAYLRIIERTRLLYNTQAELGEVVGFSLESGN